MKKIMFNDKYGLTEAVLNGSKTMTRRIIPLTDTDRDYLENAFDWDLRESVIIDRYARYKAGDIVAVAQSYHVLNKAGFVAPEWCEHTCEDSPGYSNKMFVAAELMPHRIRITDIKVERLQDISDNDCIAEGIKCFPSDVMPNLYTFEGVSENWKTAREAFAHLIDKVSGKGTWDSNPWGFAYTFELERMART